jgi:hypothetical protein
MHGATGMALTAMMKTAVTDAPVTVCPSLATRASERRRLFGYAARGVPYGPDDQARSVVGRRLRRLICT